MGQTDFELEDTGKRELFDTGAMREIIPGKGRYDLISPRAMRRLAIVMEKGAAKYEARNWEAGLPLSSFVNSAIRHLNRYLAGETGEDHAAQAFWNIHCLIHTAEMIEQGHLPAELDDLPDFTGCTGQLDLLKETD